MRAFAFYDATKTGQPLNARGEIDLSAQPIERDRLNVGGIELVVITTTPAEVFLRAGSRAEVEQIGTQPGWEIL